MKRIGTWALAAMLLAAAGAAAQEVAPGPARPPLLTLSSPLLRASMDRVNLAWLMPERLPDFRLKVERPAAAEMLSPMEMDMRLRGIEVRLPMSGLWLGYEPPVEGIEPRATISIQRGF